MDDVDALIGVTVVGLGVAALPDFLVEQEVAAGKLIRLTEPAQAAPAKVFAITTSPPKRAVQLVDHLTRSLARSGPTNAHVT